MQFSVVSCLYWGLILSFANIFGRRKPDCVVLLFWFIHSKCLIQVCSQIKPRSPSKSLLGIAVSTGLIKMYCPGVNTEIWVVCVFFLIKDVASVVLVTLTDTFLSIIVNIEWETKQTYCFSGLPQMYHSTCCISF